MYLSVSLFMHISGSVSEGFLRVASAVIDTAWRQALFIFSEAGKLWRR